MISPNNLLLIYFLLISLQYHLVYSILKPYNRNEWYCGTDSIMHGVAKTIIINGCTLDEYIIINKCCYHHDKCYGRALGRKNCDKQFCKCMNVVKSKTCKLLTIGFCLATEQFGSEAYNKQEL
uniref:Phospholipase A(2) n=1 Tax=Parastrongyloides trichosuri TaxID=131310 RepID=A0A0N4Z0Y1_PARTI